MYGVATQNGVGLGVGNIPTLTSLAYPQMLNAIVLGAFSGGAPGWLYDDSRMDTLFQDAAGTTPVTALEQPVGLQLDLSQGLVLGSQQRGIGTTQLIGSATAASYNTTTGAGSVSRGASSSDQSYVQFVLSATTWYKITITTTSGSLFVRQSYGGNVIGNFPPGATTTQYVLGTTTLSITSADGNGTTAAFSALSIQQLAGNHRYQPTSANRPVWSARYNLLLATASLSTQSVTTVATTYVLYFTGSGTVTLSGTSTGTLSAGSNTITCTAGTLTLTVSGSVLTADLRPADQAVGRLPPYQAVVTASNYDSVGFPAGLRWNGSNSWMQNASGDFSGTNKVNAFIGLRRLSTAEGIFTELSANGDVNNGAFFLDSINSQYSTKAKGTAAAVITTPASFAPPVTNVFAFAMDIGAPSTSISINGVQQVSSTATQGTGNLGNYPAYFGARGGTSMFFNGLTFSNIAIGIELSASQIAAFEAWTNSKARAY